MMAEWHVPPDYIVNNWTEELLDLMIRKMVKRRLREASGTKGETTRVSDTELFRKTGVTVKGAKHGDEPGRCGPKNKWRH